MIYTSEDNWYKWKYGDGPIFGRQTANDEFRTFYNPGRQISHVESFKEELSNAARSTLEHYPGLRPCVLFSGGADSELVIRAYLEIGIKPDVLIFRFEKDYNIHDVSYAVTICLMLNVDYKIVDFNIEKFFENDAEHISELAQIDRPRALPHLKFMEYTDQLAIYGIGDPRWARLNDDYSKKGNWVLIDQEHDTSWDKYIIHQNKPAIAQWFKWTPELVLAYLKLEWFNNLINDKYQHKLGVTSTKLLGYKEAYPTMIDRSKYTGFEKVDPLINEFEQFLIKKYGSLPFRHTHVRTLEQLYAEILSNDLHIL